MPWARLHLEARAKAAGKGHFRHRHRQAAIGNVVAGIALAGLDQAADEVAVDPLRRQVDRRRRPGFAALQLAAVKRLIEMAAGFAEENEGIALALQGEAGDTIKIGDQADAADHGRRQDGLALGFVIERDIA